MSGPDPISRRELLRGRFLGSLAERLQESLVQPFAPDQGALPEPATGAAATSARYRQSFPVLRPPGAVEEEAFLAGCTRCNACIEACPHDAIIHASSRFRRAAGTPMIDPVRGPCMMCADTPCVAACEPGVLRADLPKRMGVASIDVTTCLAHQRSFCTTCSEHCPVPGAIEVVAGKPRIIEHICTGCGVCQHMCPAPHNAVLLMPLAERPLPPHSSNEPA